MSLHLYPSRPSLSPDRHRGLHGTNDGVIYCMTCPRSITAYENWDSTNHPISDKRTKGGLREDACSEVFIPPRAWFKVC